MWGSLGTHLLWHGLDRPGRNAVCRTGFPASGDAITRHPVGKTCVGRVRCLACLLGLLFMGVFLSELPFTLFFVGFIAAVVFARVSGAPGWGLIAGFGIWAIWIGLSVSFIWIVVGVLLVGLAGTLFVQNREPVASTATPES